MNTLNLFKDTAENGIAVLGSKYLHEYVNDGKLNEGFCILSDKRLYFKGKHLNKLGSKIVTKEADTVIDLEDIVSINKSKIGGFWGALHFGLMPITIIVIVLMTICAFLELGGVVIVGSETITNLGLILALLSFLLEIKVGKKYYEIHCKNECIALDILKYTDDEVKCFEKKLIETKNKVLIEKCVKPIVNE